MKIKSLLQLVMVVLAGQFLFPCSSAEYYRFSSAKPATYQKSLAKADASEALKENTPTMTATETEVSAPAQALTVAEPALEASAAAPTPVLFEKKPAVAKASPAKAPIANAPVLTAQQEESVSALKARVASMSKAEKKAFKKEVLKAARGTNAVDTVVLVIPAILLPPLAVFLYEGVTNRFWISILLTILLIVPGIIYSLLVVTDSI